MEKGVSITVSETGKEESQDVEITIDDDMLIEDFEPLCWKYK